MLTLEVGLVSLSITIITKKHVFVFISVDFITIIIFKSVRITVTY